MVIQKYLSTKTQDQQITTKDAGNKKPGKGRGNPKGKERDK